MCGARRPGYRAHEVQEWIKYMQGLNVERVCCLMQEHQVKYYEEIMGEDLLSVYRREFGGDNVLWMPMQEYELVDREALRRVLGFLRESDERDIGVVVHCQHGLGPTGQILAAWLTCFRGYSTWDALSMVVSTGRNPYEPVQSGNASEEELHELLETICGQDT